MKSVSFPGALRPSDRKNRKPFLFRNSCKRFYMGSGEANIEILEKKVSAGRRVSAEVVAGAVDTMQQQ